MGLPLAGLFAGWMRRRQQPTPCPRPEGYAITGESWPGYVPPEPRTQQQAEAVRLERARRENPGYRALALGTAARGPHWAQDARSDVDRALLRPEAYANQRASYGAGLMAARPEAMVVLRDVAQQRDSTDVASEQWRRATTQRAGCDFDPWTLMCATHGTAYSKCKIRW